MAFSKPKAHERAERFAAKGQHDKAAREYQAIVEHDPKDIRAWLMLADCLVRCGDKAGAIERYVRVGQFYVDEREVNKALAVFKQVLNLDPQRLDILSKVAALNLQAGHVADGIGIFERVAQIQLQTGRIADALVTFKIIADADPGVVAKRLRLAELYSREKRTKEAVEAFRLAGEQLREAGRLTDYVRVAERLLYHDATDLTTIRSVAQAYLHLGDPRRALMKLNGLLRANPQDEEGIELLAETFMGLGKPEKAISALEELARGLRAKGPQAKADAIRILRRGLEWRPGHAEFREALTELEGRRRSGPQPAASAQPEVAQSDGMDVDVDVDEEEEIDLDTLDEGDLVELDDDDLVIEEVDEARTADQVSAVEGAPPTSVVLPETGSAAPGVRRTTELEAVPSAEPSLTQSVLSEVESDHGGPPEGLTDFDKILFEARVYIKYRLFEHALDHVQTALSQQPQHVGALSLRARAFTELGRTDEAADVHLHVAELVMQRDPKLAREHVGAARSLQPDHPQLAAFAQALGEAQAQAQPAPAPEQRSDVEDGDSGAFDLDFDAGSASSSGPAPVVRADSVAFGLEPEPGANLVSAHDEDLDGPSTQPFTPIDLSADEPPQEVAPARRARSKTPAGGIVPVAPQERPRPSQPVARPEPEEPERFDRTLLQHPGLPLPRPTPAPEPEAPAEPEVSVEPASDAVPFDETDAVFSDLQIDDEVDLSQPEPTPAPTPTPTPAPAPAPTPAPAPVAPAAPPGGWPDISDDLAEIRFYIDQGLDEDAEAALGDLEEKHGGHPEIASFRAEHGLGGGAPADDGLVESGASDPLIDVGAAASQPLLSLDEDDDEDAYLSAIFADPSESKTDGSMADAGGAGANLAEGQAVDAATAFDLGVAYREMGLVDAAITQFETASSDAGWRVRALTMLGTLRVHRGETDQAIEDLREAVGLATEPHEASEAAYELGMVYDMIGDAQAAIEQLRKVAPGYRERDAKLAELGG